MTKLPAVRESDDAIEIDVKRGHWPYAKMTRTEDGGVVLVVDCNEAGQVIGSGVGISGIRISAKKARRLREWLERTEA